MMRYCTRCVLPFTRPNLEIGGDGLCNACRAHDSRPRIDWGRREAEFREVVLRARERRAAYDCVIPVSGGKDSTWQVVRCLEAGLHPLAVSWKPPFRTDIGRRNLENLIGLGVDHIDCQVNPKVERKLLVASFERFGATAIPMHLAMFNIPLSTAVRYGIPLVVWGENSAFEYGGAEDARRGFRMDRAWMEKYGVTHGTTAEDWISPELDRGDLAPYFGPSEEELEHQGVLAVFLGYYHPWDPQATYAVAREHGFRPRPEGPKTGYYDFADIDDEFISIHHWLKWYKFGFTRLFDNLSLEIRNGRMTRPHAIEIIREKGDQLPSEDIDRFCSFTGISRSRFFEIAERFRSPGVWTRQNGVWTIPGFLVPDWRWS